jgi:hypothetical protein
MESRHAPRVNRCPRMRPSSVARTETGALRLRLHRNQARLLVEVQDTGMSPPVLQSPGTPAESGHGLMLIDALSSTRGYYYSGAYKIVWFEMRLTVPPLSRLHRIWPPLTTLGLRGRRAHATPARYRVMPSGHRLTSRR